MRSCLLTGACEESGCLPPMPKQYFPSRCRESCHSTSWIPGEWRVESKNCYINLIFAYSHDFCITYPCDIQHKRNTTSFCVWHVRVTIRYVRCKIGYVLVCCTNIVYFSAVFGPRTPGFARTRWWKAEIKTRPHIHIVLANKLMNFIKRNKINTVW